MTKIMDKGLIKAIKILLFLTVLTPLVFAPSLVFPFVTGKAFFFRILVELAAVLFIVLLVWRPAYLNSFLRLLQKPLMILVGLFLLSGLVSTFVAVDPFKAFFGDAERMDGLFGMLHYAAFLVLAVYLFDKNEWRRYLKLSLGVGAVLGVYGLFHYFGYTADNAYYLPPPRSPGRPDSSLGNSSFVSGHFLMMLGIAVTLWWRSVRNSWQYWLLMGLSVFSVMMVFIGGARGSLVGLVVGLAVAALYFTYHGVSLGARKIAMGVLIGLVVSVGFFGVTRNWDFWLSVPGLGRIAKLTVNDATLQTRFLSWRSGFEAFRERPILGWGPDNFNVAYNKYYNPDYAKYENRWFDRAHNRLVDVAVMQGLFGLLAYLIIFAWVMLKLWRSKDYRLAAPLIFVFVSYFFHNLFIFDHISSYVMFFAFLGFVFDMTKREDDLSQEPVAIWLKKGAWLALVVLLLAILYSLYAFNLVPIKQARAYIRAAQIDDGYEIEKLTDDFLGPKTMVQGYIADAFISFLEHTNSYGNAELDFLTEKSVVAMEDYLKTHPYDPRMMIRLSEAYVQRGKRDNDKAYYEKAVAILKKGLELAPKRQDLHYQLAYSLIPLEKTDEAIATAQRAVDLSPEVGRAHYILGLILALSPGEDNRRASEEAVARAFELGGLYLDRQDYLNLGNLYGQNILFYVKKRDAAGVIRNAEAMKIVDESIVDDLNIVIEAAEKRDWATLDKMLQVR